MAKDDVDVDETQHEDNDRVQSPKAIIEGNESPTLGSGSDVETALVKFFGGPPHCLIDLEPPNIQLNPKEREIPGCGAFQAHLPLPPPSSAPISWTDLLSNPMTWHQDHGFYKCHIQGKVVAISAENYHFISLGYPQRMMQSSSSEPQRIDETPEPIKEQNIEAQNIVLHSDTDLSDDFVSDLTDPSTGSDVSDQTLAFHHGASYAPQKIRAGILFPIHLGTQPGRPTSHEEDFACEIDFPFASSSYQPKYSLTGFNISTHIGESSEASVDVRAGSPTETGSSNSKSPITSEESFISRTQSPTKNHGANSRIAIAGTEPKTSSRKVRQPIYSAREISEGPSFIKALIQAGTPWEKQEQLYAAEFGVARTQTGVLQRFNLNDMKSGDFEPAAFKKPARKVKSRATGFLEFREYSVSAIPLKANDGYSDKGLSKGEERDPSPFKTSEVFVNKED